MVGKGRHRSRLQRLIGKGADLASNDVAADAGAILSRWAGVTTITGWAIVAWHALHAHGALESLVTVRTTLTRYPFRAVAAVGAVLAGRTLSTPLAVPAWRSLVTSLALGPPVSLIALPGPLTNRPGIADVAPVSDGAVLACNSLEAWLAADALTSLQPSVAQVAFATERTFVTLGPEGALGA